MTANICPKCCEETATVTGLGEKCEAELAATHRRNAALDKRAKGLKVGGFARYSVNGGTATRTEIVELTEKPNRWHHWRGYTVATNSDRDMNPRHLEPLEASHPDVVAAKAEVDRRLAALEAL